MTETEKREFWGLVRKTEGCWVWQGKYSDESSPYFSLRPRHGKGGYTHSASKASYFLHYGIVTTIKNPVRHTCNNSGCVRPDHLYTTFAGDSHKFEHIDETCQCSGRRCTHCSLVKCVGMFNKSPSKEGTRLPRCRQCEASLRRQDTYDMPEGGYDQMVKLQGGACEICGFVSRLVVDHDHNTDKVRDLLCVRCNLLLGHSGQSGDSKEVLRRSIRYLSKHSGATEGLFEQYIDG